MGAILQTFMLECGIDETKVSICVTFFQVVQTITMLLISKVAENIKNILKNVGICYFSYSVLIVAMLFISIKTNISIDIKYLIIFFAGTVVSLFIGLMNILVYKQPHLIFNIKDYGRITGQSGVISGILGIAITSFMTLALRKFDFFKTMIAVCLFGICLSFVAGFIGFIYIPLIITTGKPVVCSTPIRGDYWLSP